MPSIGRMLLVIGLSLAALGLLLIAAPRLPGNIILRGENWRIYFPLGTSLLLSVLLTLVLYFLHRL